jgi:hypothetical protein
MGALTRRQVERFGSRGCLALDCLTGPNTSDTPRRAWSLALHAKAAPRDAPLAKPWLAFGAPAARV